jgi:hypothetical protein
MPQNNDQFDWMALIPHALHPLKVAIIEAMGWIEEPLSAKDLDQLFDEEFGLSLVSYHMRMLGDMGVLEKAYQEAVRGALQRFYVLKVGEPVGPAAHCE